MGQKYWNTILTNGNMGTTLGINGVKNWQYALIACWCNYMRENEYNPIHNHEGEISAIIHLNSIKTTENIKSNIQTSKNNKLEEILAMEAKNLIECANSKEHKIAVLKFLKK